MKYDLNITLLLIGLFVSAQIVGLVLVNGSIAEVVTMPTGEIVIEHTETPIERPPTQGAGSFLYIVFGVGAATLMMLAIIKLGLLKLWKLWFFLAVWLTITMALSVYLATIFAAAIAFLLAVFKIFRRNPVIYNVTEILIYSGIVVLFVPLFDVLWATALLLSISVYDIIAVRRTKHMVTMAKFLMKSELFAGLSVPLGRGRGRAAAPAGKREKGTTEGHVQRNAILGGGDIAFPMLFTGVVMESLIKGGLGRLSSLLIVLTVTLFATAALGFLFWIAERDRFYPAMPFLTAGCLAGYGAVQAALFLFA
jgi:presenilin-like A22 family membrane protease